MTTDERLAVIETTLKELKLDFDNHLQDHKKYMYFAFTTCIGLILTLIVLILKLV
jgi:hypothetical protein